jgi:hypothetical protein
MLKPSYANVVATAALIAALGGTAIASSDSGTTTVNAAATATKKITACSVKKGAKKGQLRIASKCKKSESKLTWDGASSDSGLVAFFDKACPNGWAAYGAAAGRTLVGTPAGGAIGAAVGTALANQENRAVGQHAHGVVDPGHTHSVNAGNTVNAGNVPFVRFQSNGSDELLSAGNLTTLGRTTGIAIANAGGVAGTNAPYVQLTACRKL